MIRRPAHIPLRRPVYIGCEGASEVSYAGFIQDLLREADLPIHLVIEEMAPGAGDPLSRIEMAARRLEYLKQARTVPRERFVLLDFDQAERDPHRAEQARRLAVDINIIIVWQRRCFEAVLLRHLDGRASHRPPDTPSAGKALLRYWPDYQKPMPRYKLVRQLDLAAVLRAAAVEPELNIMLRCLGLI